jgi:hypothetical protein
MNNHMRVVLVVCFAALLSAPTLAQTAVPSPPMPADNGPSLAVTLNFIQDKISEVGKLNYVAYSHDNIANTDSTNQFTVEVSNVAAHPDACVLSYHIKATRDGAITNNADGGFPFNLIQKVMVMTGDQDINAANVAAGAPSLNSRVDPPHFALIAQRKGGATNTVYFADEDTANRVAKAMIHAVELCGGGNKDPF